MFNVPSMLSDHSNQLIYSRFILGSQENRMDSLHQNSIIYRSNAFNFNNIMAVLLNQCYSIFRRRICLLCVFVMLGSFKKLSKHFLKHPHQLQTRQNRVLLMFAFLRFSCIFDGGK